MNFEISFGFLLLVLLRMKPSHLQQGEIEHECFRMVYEEAVFDVRLYGNSVIGENDCVEEVVLASTSKNVSSGASRKNESVFAFLVEDSDVDGLDEDVDIFVESGCDVDFWSAIQDESEKFELGHQETTF